MRLENPREALRSAPDGHSYTQRQFIDHYGGTVEWNAALPRTAPAQALSRRAAPAPIAAQPARAAAAPLDEDFLMQFVAQMRAEQAEQMASFKAQLESSLVVALQAQLASVDLAAAAAAAAPRVTRTTTAPPARRATKKRVAKQRIARRKAPHVAALRTAPPVSDRERVAAEVRRRSASQAEEDAPSEEDSVSSDSGSESEVGDEAAEAAAAAEADAAAAAAAAGAADAKAEAAATLLRVEDPAGGPSIQLEAANPAAQILLESRRMVDSDPMLVKARAALAERDAERARARDVPAAGGAKSDRVGRKKKKKKKRQPKKMSRRAAALAATLADAAALADAEAAAAEAAARPRSPSNFLVCPPGMGPNDVDSEMRKGNASALFDRNLQENEWENEIARSILTLFRAQQQRGSGGAAVRDRAGAAKGAASPKGGAKAKRATPRRSATKKSHARATPPPQPKSKRGGGAAVPKRYLSRQIWFGGGGTLIAEWSAAASEAVCHRLDVLAKDGRPLEYVALAEQVLVERHRRIVLPQIMADVGGLTRSAQHTAALARRRSGGGGGRRSAGRSAERSARSSRRSRGANARRGERDEWGDLPPGDESEEEAVPPPPVRDESSAPALHREQLLWRQLTSACCIFAWRLARAGRFADSLGLLKKAEEVTEDERSPFVDRRELRAFYLDGFAHYYYRRNKGNAALDYAQKALRLHMQLGSGSMPRRPRCTSRRSSTSCSGTTTACASWVRFWSWLSAASSRMAAYRRRRLRS